MSTIAVLGMPNTGKSTLFNQLTGSHAHIGNWPGITVDLMQADVDLQGTPAQLVDLPGIYDLRGHSDDEAVVRRFLESTRLDLVVVVLNASQLDRQLRLALQVRQLGLPAVLLLNMADEAKRFGVTIDTTSLAEELAMPVVLLSAKYRRGLGEARHQMAKAIAKGLSQEGPDGSQAPVAHLDACLAEGDDALQRQIAQLMERSVTLPPQWRDRLTRRLDGVLLHPLLGLPLFFLVMALMFQAIYAIGVPLQEALGTLLDSFGQGVIAPLIRGLPAFAQGFLLEGSTKALAR